MSRANIYPQEGEILHGQCLRVHGKFHVCRQVKRFEIVLPVIKLTMYHMLRHPKSQTISKSYHWFKSYSGFPDGWILPIGVVASRSVRSHPAK